MVSCDICEEISHWQSNHKFLFLYSWLYYVWNFFLFDNNLYLQFLKQFQSVKCCGIYLNKIICFKTTTKTNTKNCKAVNLINKNEIWRHWLVQRKVIIIISNLEKMVYLIIWVKNFSIFQISILCFDNRTGGYLVNKTYVNSHIQN